MRDKKKKIENLGYRDYLKLKILIPALAFAKEREDVTTDEHSVLLAATHAPTSVVLTSDLSKALPKRNSTQLIIRQH